MLRREEGREACPRPLEKRGIGYFPNLQAAPRCNCNEKYLDIRINSLALALSAWAFASEKLTSKCCQSFINIANRRKP